MRRLMLCLTAIALVATACHETVTASSDEHICIYSDEDNGRRLVSQLPPGSEPVTKGHGEEVVRIPASNRFYMAHPDRTIADPGAPVQYEGNASGGVPVFVFGQDRFRFNLETACEWYAEHGRRNLNGKENLGFNVRGDASQGWLIFLNENFGQTMQEIVSEVMSRYDWADLHYNFPVNANEAGIVPEGQQPGEPTRQKLGRELGAVFTERLRNNLGGNYFCGIDPSPDGEDSACPPIRFQVVYAGPGNDSTLVKDRQKVEDTKQALETARLEGDLRSAQQGQLLEAERSKAAVLEEQARTAELQARIDNAKCRELAELGLDCEGKRPPVIVSGQPAG